MKFDDLTQLITMLSVLAAASERLVESIKKVIPGLSPAAPALEPGRISSQQDSTREGVLSILAIACGIATAGLAYAAGGLLPVSNNVIVAVPLYGLLIAGGSRLWNPLVEWLKAVKDTKVKDLKNSA